ncbi:DNA/RNA helicase domain-containing protein, partial [Clostridioides difficile]
VPGAGKTLAGLNIAIERQKVDENEHAVFLSGNGPLVDVLQEALARDDVTRNGIRKSEAIRKAKEFIQIIHHFRDEAISVDTPPIERVTIFDEAQRAWDEPNLTNF